MTINPDQIHAAARVFYEDQTGSDNYDTSAYQASWYRVAERALKAALDVKAPALSCRCEFGWQHDCPHHRNKETR